MQFFSGAIATSSAALFGSRFRFTRSEGQVFACGHVKRTHDPNIVAEEVAMPPSRKNYHQSLLRISYEQCDLSIFINQS